MINLHYPFYTFDIPPTLYLTLSVIGGIVIATNFPATWWIVSICILILASLCSLAIKQKNTIVMMSGIFFCMSGFLCTNQHSRQDFFYATLNNKNATLYGTIESIEHEHKYPHKTKIIIACKKIEVDGVAKNNISNTRTSLYTNHASEFCVEDSIKITNAVCSRSSNDFKRYLAKEKIDGGFFVAKHQITLISRPFYSFWRFLSNIKQRLTLNLQQKMSPSCFAFFSSLFLGNKKNVQHAMQTIKSEFKKWGISHYLARSGLHMILFIAIWQLLIICLPLHFIYKECFLLLIGLLYCALTLPSTSFNRAAFAFVAFKACLILGKRSHSLAIISAITLGVLLYNPMTLFFLDFQLSFGLAFLLSWLNQLTAQKRIVSTST